MHMGGAMPGNRSATPDDQRVSVVVVSYFTGPVLIRSVASLQAQKNIAEIILIDNGNFDGDVEAAIACDDPHAAPIQVITGQGNIGFAAACNLGASKAKMPYLLFFNPDAIMPLDGVSQMISDGLLLARPWMMGAKLIDPDTGCEQQGSRRATLTPWRAFLEGTKLYRLAPEHPYFRRFNLHQGEAPSTVTPLPTISGACIFLPRDDYFSIDGMDERYFLHVEDIDFCLRFAKAGGSVFYNPHVVIAHYKSSSRANPVKIEARKTAGIITYFNQHFSKAYPRPFLWIVALGLWMAFGLLVVKRSVLKFLRLIGLQRRVGHRGVKKAKAISNRRQSR